jgi:hypothetical protein
MRKAKYDGTMLTREESTIVPVILPKVKGLVWNTDGSKMLGNGQAKCLWAIFGKKAQYLSMKIC